MGLQRPKLREYRPGTFDKRVAYGQRDRKLMLVARGIIKGFKVKCRSERSAQNLAYALRIRASRIEWSEEFHVGVKVKLDARTVYVVGTARKAGRAKA